MIKMRCDSPYCLAKQYGRYGTRKITARLHIEGWTVHHKKVERLGGEEGLQVPRRHTSRKHLYDHQPSILCMHPLYPKPICSVDLVQGRLIGDAATGCSPSWMNTRIRV